MRIWQISDRLFKSFYLFTTDAYFIFGVIIATIVKLGQTKSFKTFNVSF